jgi:rod shape determining protein RodA
MIAAEAPTAFTRLLAGAITLSFFTYAFVNMGMVSGILPVVGIPLPSSATAAPRWSRWRLALAS